MGDMLGGSCGRAPRAAFIPQVLSMNSVVNGMIPTIAELMSRGMAAMHASSLRFWCHVARDARRLRFAYAFNLWLVGVRLKHGMGTTRALGQGWLPHSQQNKRRSV